MRCEDFQDRISAFVEDEQDQNIRHLMDAHLAECPACAEALQGVRKVVAVLGGLRSERPSTDFHFALRGRLLMEVARYQRFASRAIAWLFPSAPRTALAGGVAIVVLVGSAFFFSQPRYPSDTGDMLKMEYKAAIPPMRIEEIPSYYVLERVPALSHRSVTISSRVAQSRIDSQSTPYLEQISRVRYVRF